MNTYIKSNRGNASMVGFALVGVLGAVGLIVENQNRKVSNLQQNNAITNVDDAITLANTSKLLRMRALLSSANAGTKALPALFPKNYFDMTDTQLQQRPAVMGNGVTQFQPKDFQLSDPKTVTINAPSISAFGAVTDATTADIKVIAARRINYKIYALEVQVTSKDAKTSRTRVDKARIPIPDPQSWNLNLQISTDNGVNWNNVTDNYTIKRGVASYRVLADGVVFDANILVNGDTKMTNIAGNKSGATNIYGTNQLVAAFQKDFAEDINPPKKARYLDANKLSLDLKAMGCKIDTIDGGVNTDLPIILSVVVVDPMNPGGILPGQQKDYNNVILPAAPESADASDAQSGDIVTKCPNACVQYQQTYSDDWYIGSNTEALKQTKAGVFKPIMHWLAKGFVKGPYGVCADYSVAGPEAMAKDPSISDWQGFIGAVEGNGSPIAHDVNYVAFDLFQCQERLIFARQTCGCFNAQTRIRLIDGSDKPIEQILNTDVVYNPIAGSGYTIKKIIRGPEKKPMIAVTIDGYTVEVTDEHPFITRKGLISAGAVKVGDELLNARGGYSTVDAKESIQYVEPPIVWNIELLGGEEASEHYILADGVLTGDLYLQNQLKQKK